MDFKKLIGAFSCDKAWNVETNKLVEPDGSTYLPFQSKVKFEIGDTDFTWLNVTFTGAIGNKGEIITRVGKLVNISNLGMGFIFENTGNTHIPFYFFPVEFAGEKEINGKLNYLMIMNLNDQRVVIKLEK